MAVPAVNIQINRGTDFTTTFSIKTDTGVVKDLTGYSGISSISKFPTDTTNVKGFTVGIASTTGVVTISMGRTDTAGLEEGRNYYDVILISPSGDYSKAIEGSVIVSPSVSV